MEDYGKYSAAILLSATVLISGCFSGPSDSKHREQADATTVLTELAALLQEAVPAGWRVSENMFCSDERRSKGETNLEMFRVAQVSFPEAPMVNLGDTEILDDERNGGSYTFYLNLHKTKYLTMDEYKMIKDRNKAIDDRCRDFTESLMDVPRNGKARAFDDIRPYNYNPVNEKQTKRVAEYHNFYNENPKTFLPQDFHYKKMAFILYDPRHGLMINDESFEAECNAVIRAIKTVMDAY